MKTLLKNLSKAYKMGVKKLYYHTTRDGANNAQADMEDYCAGGACKISIVLKLNSGFLFQN